MQNVPAYKRSSEEQLTAEAFTNAYYVDIYTGDKAGKATVHDASFTEEKTIDGWASWPLSFDVTVQMTGDTLNLQKVDGYKELYDSYEKGEKITHYGVDSSVDLAEYFDIVAPGRLSVEDNSCGLPGAGSDRAEPAYQRHAGIRF